MFISQQEFLDRTYALAQGLGILHYYTEAYDCLVNTSVLFNRYENAFDGFNNPPDGSTFKAWLEMTLTIGNTSLWYKSCY